MPLSREVAGKIIDVVKHDPPSCQAMHWALTDTPSFISALLELKGWAGGLRNWQLLLFDDPGTPEYDERVCTGIATLTQQAIMKAVSAKQLPADVKGAFIPERASSVLKIKHTATSVHVGDDWYIFDWHATLKPGDPEISHEDQWMKGNKGVNYLWFLGFD